MSEDQYLVFFVSLAVLVFVGPSVVALLRRVDGFGPLVLLNMFCLVVPPLLIALWWLALTRPGRTRQISRSPYSRQSRPQ